MTAPPIPAPPRTAPPGHLPTLDGVRGLAALLVVFSHAHNFDLPQLVPHTIGTWGVMLFFALSGFLMAHIYFPRPFGRRAAADYLAARIVRIVPLYYTVVIAAWLIHSFVTADFHYPITDFELLRHLAFVGSKSVFWSIGPEFQFYFVFPLLWWAVDRWRAGAVLPLALVFGASAALFLFQPWSPGILFVSKLHIFLAGAGVAVLRRHVAERLAGSWLVAALQTAAFGLLIAWALPQPWLGDFIYAPRHDVLLNVYYADPRRVLMVCLIVFALSFASPVTSAVFANPPARWLGAISFSLYLLHLPIFWLLERLGLFAAVPGVPGFLAGALAACAVSWASYRSLEVPTREGWRRPLAMRLTAASDALPGRAVPER